MGHAIALVGYRRAKNGKLHYLMQNSWGKGWGEKGFAYIDEDTFNKNLRYAYVVDVDVPKGTAPPPPQKLGQKCKKGLFPDAVSEFDKLVSEVGTAAKRARCHDGNAFSRGLRLATIHRAWPTRMFGGRW